MCVLQTSLSNRSSNSNCVYLDPIYLTLKSWTGHLSRTILYKKIMRVVGELQSWKQYGKNWKKKDRENEKETKEKLFRLGLASVVGYLKKNSLYAYLKHYLK